MRIILKILIPLLLTTFFVYLPFVINSSLLLDRHNDLAEFFWPIIHYIKESIYTYKQIPLWNNLFFMGTPLVSDPQNLFWYLPNIIFLALPIDVGIITAYIVHALFGGYGMYLFCKNSKLSKNASILSACLLIASPKLAGYIEAGHYGLVLSFYWLPWAILATKKLVYTPKISWSILLAITLSSIYFNHILTAFITAFAIAIFGIFTFFTKPNLKSIIYAAFTASLFFAIIFPAFLTQQEWFPQTTRDLLLTRPDVYPKWLSEIEFIKNFFFASNLETEKILTSGVFILILAAVGFSATKKYVKFLVFLFAFIIVLIAANNMSPVYDILIQQNWYILLRVATRLWFVVTLMLLILAAYGFDFIYKRQKSIAYLLALLAVIQSVLISYKIFTKPISTPQRVPTEVYTFLSSDHDYFRVFCTTRCLGQKEAAQYHLQLADGYGTLQQKNYYEAAKQIGQYYSDKYSLSIPPFDVYLYQNLQPHSPTLAHYGVKYVVSPHTLTDPMLSPIATYSRYTIYKNTLFTSPSYDFYSPNEIRVNNKNSEVIVVIPEIYNHNWRAYDLANNSLEVFETREHTIGITANGINMIHLKFQPFKN